MNMGICLLFGKPEKCLASISLSTFSAEWASSGASMVEVLDFILWYFTGSGDDVFIFFQSISSACGTIFS